MRLISARLQQIRQHQRLELEFDPHFTLIGGPNEVGKSTVAEALHKGLFLKANATGKGVEELRSRSHSGLPEIEIRFEAAGQPWQLRKRFSGASGTCQLSNSAGLALSGSAAEAQLAALLGVEGPVEGRRIAQLPLRWAHLWVRQGEAGHDLLAGGPEAYDLPRLLQQLQHAEGSASQRQAAGRALESGLDRRVLERLEQRLGELFTGTGRIKAGSPLAIAQQRDTETQAALNQAQQRLADLEAAMEQLRQIELRLQQIDGHERPDLERQLEQSRLQQQQWADLEARLLLVQAQRQAPGQQRNQLIQAQAQAIDLEQQRQTLRLQQQQQQQRHQQLLQDASVVQATLESALHQRHQLEQQQRDIQIQLDAIQVQLDLAALEREASQLRQHQQQFEQLQQQASAVKAALQQLPPLGEAQVKQLREAEQQLAQAEARCQGMAASVHLTATDQRVELDGVPLLPGQSRQLERDGLLKVGSGVQVRISPGGGGAIERALQQKQQRLVQLKALHEQLGVSSSEVAEGLAQQRLALDAELTNLRQAAAKIPWAQLGQQIGALQPRRQRLLQALERLRAGGATSTASPASVLLQSNLDAQREGLEAQQESLRLQGNQLASAQQQLDQTLKQSQQHHDAQAIERQEIQAALDQLTAALISTESQAERLTSTYGTPTAIAVGVQALNDELANLDQQLNHLATQRQALEATTAAQTTPEPLRQGLLAHLQQLEAEKEALLTNRGTQDQICRSLGAQDPVAAVDHHQAAWELANAELVAIREGAAALQLLKALFDQAQQAMAERYGQPLSRAIHVYLDALNLQDETAAQLRFDPQQGFTDLRLQQSEQSYAVGQLSGGMREQLGAALRLALADVLSPAYDNVLPLLFDDAFSNSDPLRLAGVKHMLAIGVQQGIQILLLSCNPDDYTDLAATLGRQISLEPGINPLRLR